MSVKQTYPLKAEKSHISKFNLFHLYNALNRKPKRHLLSPKVCFSKVYSIKWVDTKDFRGLLSRGVELKVPVVHNPKKKFCVNPLFV